MRTPRKLIVMALSIFVALIAPVKAQFSADHQTNTYSGAVTDWGGASYVFANSFDVMQVINNGGLTNVARVFMGLNSGNDNNTALVSGSGSRWNVSGSIGDIIVGYQGGNNQMIITNSGDVASAVAWIGYFGNNNTAQVSGGGSLWNVSGNLTVGYDAVGNQLTINNGGQVVNAIGVIGGLWDGSSHLVGASNNSVLVTGVGSVWSNTSAFVVGSDGPGNRLTIADGGRVVSSNYGAYVAYDSISSNNTVLVTGSGSLWSAPSIYFASSIGTAGNQLTITNGGQVIAPLIFYSGNWAASSNAVQIRGGGLLEANKIQVAGSDAASGIANVGGIYQFTTNTPEIILTGGSPVTISNGWIAFRAITNADVAAVSGITYQGDNSFRLNNASNWSATSQDYIFDTGRGATNYANLEMINGGTAWRSATLGIGGGGKMLVSNTVAAVAGVVTNSGTINVVDSRVTWQNDVLVRGGYWSDPSTNTFSGDLTVSGTGYIAAAAGDVYALNRDFLLQSSNRAAFNMSQAQVVFTNDGSGANNHVLNLTNGLAFDLGKDFTNFLDLALVTNFSIGTLTIAPGNNVRVTGVQSAATSNALYIGELDIGGTTNNLASLLSLDVNVYYDGYDPANAYLNYQTYSLGSGLLIPIPEANTAALTLFGALATLILRRGRRESRA